MTVYAKAGTRVQGTLAEGDVTISGLKELDELLSELPKRIARNAVRGALRAGAVEIRKLALSYVPRESGDLASTIRVKTGSYQGVPKAFVVAGASASGAKRKTEKGSKGYYAHMIEYGTASYYTGSGRTVGGPYKIAPKRALGHRALTLNVGGDVLLRAGVTHPGVHPQPFMRPAFDMGAKAAMVAYAAYLEARLPEEIAKLKAPS